MLYALGALSRGQEKLGFNEVEKPLRALLEEFGPKRQSYHPEYPFWRLTNDGVWLLEGAERCSIRTGNTDAKITELRKYNVKGYFREDIRTVLKSEPLLIADVTQGILDAHFAETLHGEIIERCGISLQYSKSTHKRDPNFREKILKAYQYRCAICSFQVQMDGRHLALEAAHIKWHAAGGADNENNGIAMCSLHHKLFDKGAFTVAAGKLSLSEYVYGNEGFESSLLKYHGKYIELPISYSYRPSEGNFDWHYKEVFKGPCRQLDADSI
ncbi:MAG: restriction endonuclease [Bacteroidetes bacterium]|nr:restriction endonuclease [Bacteroidota bacterium]